MRPLTIEEMEKFGFASRIDPAEQAREKEIREFWKSDAVAAELPKFSELTIQTEKSHYGRAIRRIGRSIGLDWLSDVYLCIRKDKLLIVRKKKPGADQIQHVGSSPEIMGYEK